MKLSEIVDPVYLKFLPRLSKRGHLLDLDLRYPNIRISHPEKISVPLTFYLSFIEKEGRSAHITISSTENSLIINDSETLLAPDQLPIFKGDGIKVSSRLGFGTKLIISF